MATCPACGFQNPDGLKFCGECGGRMGTGSDVDSGADSAAGQTLSDQRTLREGLVGGASDTAAGAEAGRAVSPTERFRLLEKLGEVGWGWCGRPRTGDSRRRVSWP